jgi:Derlin-1
MDPMVLSVLYVWCQLNREVIVSFWFGTRFKAMYLPWVLLGFNMLMSNGSLFAIVGILVGHLYFFLKFTYPQELGGSNFLETPSFIKRYMPDVSLWSRARRQSRSSTTQKDQRLLRPWKSLR